MTAPPVAFGDTPPAALSAYYTALDAGRVADAVAACSVDVIAATPPAVGIETDPRTLSRGRGELHARLETRGVRPFVHELLLCTVDGADVLAEGITRDRVSGAPRSSFATSVQLDGDGLVARSLTYASPEVITPLPAEANPSTTWPGSAIDKIHEYFGALDEDRFADAAACFSADIVYSHPPYKDPDVGGPGRAAFVGREALLAAFNRRGRQPIDHRIVLHVQRGPHLLLEGVVNDHAGALLGSFVSEATLDAEGLIVRYASWYTQPGLPRR